MKKIRNVILVLLSCMVVYGIEESYHRGVGAMIAGAEGEHCCWSYYYGIGVLRRHGGGNSEQVALRLCIQLASREKEGDLLDGMRDVLCVGEEKGLVDFANADGGWPVEFGGQSELWATLLAMECLLDLESPPVECAQAWKWLMKMAVDAEGIALCRHGEYEQRVVCQLLKVGGMARRHGWGLDRESHILLDSLVLWLGKCWRQEEDCHDDVYDKSLALKGLCLLGLQGDYEWLASWLVRAQLEDGHWHDDSIADDWLTTCAVVDALGTYLAATKSAEGVCIDWKDGGEEAVFGAREFVEVEIGGLSGGKDVILEIYKDGELVDFAYSGMLTDGCVSWFTGVHEAGEYDMKVVIWEVDDAVWLTETALDFQIAEDMSCRRLKWEQPMRDKVLYAGEGCETDLELSWDYDGNVDGMAVLEWELSKDGVVMDSGDVEVALVSGMRHCHYLFAQQWNMVLDDIGVYELMGRLVTEQSEYVCSRSITVVQEKYYDVENDVQPRRITLGAARLRHTLKLRCMGEDMPDGHEAGFSVTPDERRLVDEYGEKLEIELDEIFDSEGRRIMDGWLVVQSYYGQCEGDGDLQTQRTDGFLCAVKVADGKARFCMKAEDKMKRGVIAVAVYQMTGMDVKCIGERLGVFDVHLVWR